MWCPSLVLDPNIVEGAASSFRTAASPGAAVAIMKMNREIDVRHILPAIQAPTLILHCAGDRVIDIDSALNGSRHLGSSADLFADISRSGIIHGANCLRRSMQEFTRCSGTLAGAESILPRGFPAAFDSPARAIGCAGSIREAVRSLDLEVRCGLHTGCG
jgi:hypothetical protein